MPRAVVLVEGESDRAALAALARRRGLALDLAGIAIVPIGGATNVAHHLRRFVASVRVAGLYDAAEEGYFRRAVERAGLGAELDRHGLERLGFFACDTDLEDELIRAVGATGAEAVIETEGELASWRTFQRQPEWRGKPVGEQLHRFLGTRGGRKVHYATKLVEALDLDRVPRPLERVLAHVV